MYVDMMLFKSLCDTTFIYCCIYYYKLQVIRIAYDGDLGQG